ncbi:MAG: glutaredoxin 3 [Myxococcales bacterium]|nr:glutaredoxin 3 [Myxococcales bacterium]
MGATPPIRIYTKRLCPYCWRALWLLRRRHLAFEEIVVGDDPERRAWLAEVSGQRTVPQVFIGERSIGGFTELKALHQSGGLDRLLAGDPA